MLVDDKDVWGKVHPDDLWIYDKLIVAKKAGYLAGPAGIPVPQAGWYIVRPITNIRMMGRGASRCWLTPELDNVCLLYTSPSPRDRQKSRMPSSA